MSTIKFSKGKGKTGSDVKDNVTKEVTEKAEADYDTSWHKSEGLVAKVAVGLDAKINLGDYSSAGCFVSLTLPCRADADGIEEAFEEAQAWVKSKMEELTEEISS